MQITMSQNNEELFTGHPADVREKVQDIIQEKYGFYPDMCETEESEIEDGEEYEIYLHTDTYEELSDSELATLDRIGISEFGEDTMIALETVLGLTFTVIN